MDNAHKYVAGFGVALFYQAFERFRQWLVAGFVALHYFSGAFVDNYYMVVFVEYFHQAACVVL